MLVAGVEVGAEADREEGNAVVFAVAAGVGVFANEASLVVVWAVRFVDIR